MKVNVWKWAFLIGMCVYWSVYVINWPPPKSQPLAREIRSYILKHGYEEGPNVKKKDSPNVSFFQTDIDVTKITERYIPKGFNIKEAKSLLGNNGFDCEYEPLSVSPYLSCSVYDLGQYTKYPFSLLTLWSTTFTVIYIEYDRNGKVLKTDVTVRSTMLPFSI
jgi:hypothetical protein